nr:MAG TPA: hypothetical protein [Caudoviricetes sp.]
MPVTYDALFRNKKPHVRLEPSARLTSQPIGLAEERPWPRIGWGNLCRPNFANSDRQIYLSINRDRQVEESALDRYQQSRGRLSTTTPWTPSESPFKPQTKRHRSLRRIPPWQRNRRRSA